MVDHLSYKDYYDDARWTGLRHENCTDPQLLYENSVPNPKDVVKWIEYRYFEETTGDRVPLSNKQIWSYTDMRKEGRCFTASPNKTMREHGIKEVSILLWIRSRIFIHHQGFFIAERQKSFLDVNKGRKIYIDLDQEVFEYLNSKKEPCEESLNYLKDSCVLQELHNVSIYLVFTK